MDFLHTQLAVLQESLSWVSTEPLNWKLYVQIFTWSVCLFESYLLLRQYPHYSRPEPPAVIAAHYEPGAFQKTQTYSKDKAKFAFVKNLFEQCLDSTLLHYGAYAYMWQKAGDIMAHYRYGPEYQILQSNIFVMITILVSSIRSVPLSAFSTFVIEEKYGFNKTTPWIFVTDIVKGWFLGLAIGVPFMSIFLWIFDWAGDRFVPWLTGFILSFQLVMVIIYPVFIQPLFNKLSPLPEGELRTRINVLSENLQFPLKHLYEIDGSKRSSHSNAYFYGLPWSKHIVIYDTLIKQAKPEEVEAVLAHELGHWYYMHPTKMMAISQLNIFAILAFFPAFLHAPPVLRSFDFSPSVAVKPPTLIAFLLFQMIITPVETVIGVIINAISRSFEWQADQFACELAGRLHDEDMADMGDRLGKALTVLYVENKSAVWIDWLYSMYHHSHPTLLERITALEAHKQEREKSSTAAVKKEL